MTHVECVGSCTQWDFENHQLCDRFSKTREHRAGLLCGLWHRDQDLRGQDPGKGGLNQQQTRFGHTWNRKKQDKMSSLIRRHTVESREKIRGQCSWGHMEPSGTLDQFEKNLREHKSPPNTHTHKWGQSHRTVCFDTVNGMPSGIPSMGPEHAYAPLAGWSCNAEHKDTLRTLFSILF